MSDLACAFCSKPLSSGTLIYFEGDQFFHVRCRSHILQVEAREVHDKAKTTQERSSRLVAETMRRAAARASGSSAGECPVCGDRAVLTDWRPRLHWIAVEDCRCSSFFVWTALVETRLRDLRPEDRTTLSLRISGLRATQSEAWLTTRDGTVMGALIIRSERPDRRT